VGLPVGRIVLWATLAFWLWLVFAVILRRLRVPRASVVAALLAWVVAGFVAPWALASVAHWLLRAAALTRGLTLWRTS
jgi:hypothetical protein